MAVFRALCEHRGKMTGEWLFSVAAFGNQARSDDCYFDAFGNEIDKLCRKLDCDYAYLSRLRHEVLPRFVEDCIEQEDWSGCRLFGFTSTFQQNVASLALARRLKDRFPDTEIVFGGANFEGEMGPEYVRAFDFIDYAVVGEGEVAFPTLLERLAADESPMGVPGVVARVDGGVRYTEADGAIQDMNSQPLPDYDEYFTRMEALGLGEGGEIGRMLPFEASRGCWWGAKQHCTFCGLNGMGMSYRSKTPERVMSELRTLAGRYHITSFEAVDNILDLKLIDTVFREIEEKSLDYTFFFEVKANLRREQIRALSRGGVRLIQPGIESLSTNVLKLMRKGSTMLQNVQLLKWARYYRIRVGWNVIWGFPGETAEDYQRQLQVMKLISHLPPPTGYGPIWLERFSPLFANRADYPLSEVEPETSYAHVYPDHVDLEKIAYFFAYKMADSAGREHPDIAKWITEWQRRWYSPVQDSLVYRLIPDGLLIDDDRGEERRGTYFFDGALADIYLFCSDKIRSATQVAAHLGAQEDSSRHDLLEVRTALDRFCDIGLMVSEEDKYFSLALPSNPHL